MKQRATDELFDTVNRANAEQHQEDSEKLKLVDKMISEMFSTKELRMKSHLSRTQIAAIAKGYTFTTKYASDAMKKLINDVLALHISFDRKGRQEMQSGLMALTSLQREDDDAEKSERDLMSRLLGRR